MLKDGSKAAFPFTLDGNAWQVRLPDGSIVAADWSSRGAAIAGIEVELRRRQMATAQLQADPRLSGVKH